MNQLSQINDLIADTINGTYLKVTNMGGHFHLYVQAGADRIAELCGNYPTAQSACRRASYLHTALTNGVTVTQLTNGWVDDQTAVLAEANRVLIEALGATERTEAEIVEALNADGDGYAATEKAAADRFNADIAAIVGNGRGWDRFADRTRANTRHTTQAPTPVMLRAVSLRNPADEVHVQTGVAARTLEALAARGYGRLVRGGPRSRHEILKLVLNARGVALASREEMAA